MKTWNPGTVTLAVDELLAYIRGKKIALMMNTSALDNEGDLLLDKIASDPGCDVRFFLGMEHGVRGNFFGGNGDSSPVDQKTGIEIVSLYDFAEYRPPVERLREVDAVVFCAQDVGVRHWTYTPWLIELLDSAKAADVEVVILDRPNPICGDIVEGLIAEPKYAGHGLLSGFEYPLRHGMTTGELANMYNAEYHVGACVTVFKMHGWTRDMWYDDTGLMWMPPSPNMPTVDTALYFASTGLLQSSNMSLGIRTPTPFQYVGRPDIDGDALCRELRSRDLPGVCFVQKYYVARVYGEDELLCDGVMLVINDRNEFRPVTTQLHIMDALLKLFPDRVKLERDKSLGRIRMCTDEICEYAEQGKSIADLCGKWQASAREFERRRAPYLLY